MEVGHHVPEVVGPPSSANAMNHPGSMAMVQQEASYCLSDLAPSMSHEAASQSVEPSNSEQTHPDFAGGIMRIAPAEVNVSCLLLCMNCYPKIVKVLILV